MPPAHKECPHCNATFYKNQKLTQHIKKYHTIRKKVEHKCDTCQKSFSKKSHMIQHQNYCRKKAPVMNAIKESWVKNGLNIK